MNKFKFTKMAEKQSAGLPKSIQVRIIQKLNELKHQKDISTVLKRLYHLEPATHRLRIGNYRLIMQKTGSTYLILKAGDRKNIYN